MAYKHTNKFGKTLYLNAEQGSDGKMKYYFADTAGNPVDLPAGLIVLQNKNSGDLRVGRASEKTSEDF